MKNSEILIYDTTLRDGTQGEHINFSAEEKLRIARRLDEMGFHYIEGGWPGSNPKDARFFEMAKGFAFRHARLTAFGSTRKPGVRPEELPQPQDPTQGRDADHRHFRKELGSPRHGDPRDFAERKSEDHP